METRKYYVFLGATGVSVLIVAVLFAAWSFALWDINPGAWNESARGIFAMVAVGCIAATFIFAALEINQRKG